MVPPERETPGISARACANPNAMPCGIVRWSSVRFFAPGPVGEAQDDAEDHEHGGHDPERAERRLDLVLEEDAEHDDRDRADDDEPAHARVGVAARDATEERPEPVRDDAHDVAPEEHDDRRLGAELRDRGERGAGVLGAGRNSPRIRRWALDEMGRNSVSPWTNPRMSASSTWFPPSASAEAGGTRPVVGQ